jgi:hypothetical protein
MKKNVILMATTLLATFVGVAQQQKMVYVVTDEIKTGYGWNMLRSIDVNSKTTSDIILNGTAAKALPFATSTKKPIADFSQNGSAISKVYFDSKSAHYSDPFVSGVAAIALDARHNKLFYAPMRVDQLRYIDLTTNNVYHVDDNVLTGKAASTATTNNCECNVITRMTIGDDGNVYALSNDAKSFVKINGKNNKITKLAPLQDDATNVAQNITIADQQSWGGDMVATDNGEFYVISMRNRVFKVNPANSIATYVATVQGLPNQFTTNGAAVLEDGKTLLLSSANYTNGYYTLDISNWTASKFASATETTTYHASDLASSYLVKTAKTKYIDAVVPVIASNNETVAVYPNPALRKSGNFSVQLKDVPPGAYTIEIADQLGKVYLTRKVNVTGKNQLEVMAIQTNMIAGSYLVRIMNNNKDIVGNQKLIIE